MPAKGSWMPTSQPAVALATCSSQSQAMRQPQCTCTFFSENNKLQACSLHLHVVHDMICLTGTCWQERLASKQTRRNLAADLDRIIAMDVATCQRFASVDTENAVQ